MRIFVMAALALLAIPLLMGAMGGGGGSGGGIGGMFGGMFGGGGGGGSGGTGSGGGTSMTPLATGAIKAYTGSSGMLSSPAILAGGAVVTLLLLRR